MVYNSDKRMPGVDNFLGGEKCGPITHISGQYNAWNLQI